MHILHWFSCLRRNEKCLLQLCYFRNILHNFPPFSQLYKILLIAGFLYVDDVLERMMDNRTGRESRVLRGHSGPVYATSFTPDKNLCTSASEDGTGKYLAISLVT